MKIRKSENGKRRFLFLFVGIIALSLVLMAVSFFAGGGFDRVVLLDEVENNAGITEENTLRYSELQSDEKLSLRNFQSVESGIISGLDFEAEREQELLSEYSYVRIGENYYEVSGTVPDGISVTDSRLVEKVSQQVFIVGVFLFFFTHIVSSLVVCVSVIEKLLKARISSMTGRIIESVPFVSIDSIMESVPFISPDENQILVFGDTMIVLVILMLPLMFLTSGVAFGMPVEEMTTVSTQPIESQSSVSDKQIVSVNTLDKRTRQEFYQNIENTEPVTQEKATYSRIRVEANRGLNFMFAEPFDYDRTINAEYIKSDGELYKVKQTESVTILEVIRRYIILPFLHLLVAIPIIENVFRYTNTTDSSGNNGNNSNSSYSTKPN